MIVLIIDEELCEACESANKNLFAYGNVEFANVEELMPALEAHSSADSQLMSRAVEDRNSARDQLATTSVNVQNSGKARTKASLA